MKTRTALLSLAHAAVDFACAALFFGLLQERDVWYSMVLYNAFAFLMQLPMGIIADRLDKNIPFAAMGCGLVAIAFMLTKSPITAAIIAGIGNGAFHVGGGIEILNGSDGKAGPLGVFVSPGAIGLYLGTFYADLLSKHAMAVALLMVLFGAALLLYYRRAGERLPHNAEFSVSMPKGGAPALIALFVVVALRSFMGTASAFKTGDALSSLPPVLGGLIPVLCLAFGKAAGGFVSDAIGPKKTGVISLGLCALALFFPVSPYVTLFALFLFNMTMPITLFASARLLKNAKGAAFGLLTAALFVGCIPAFFGIRLSAPAYVNGLLALLSLGLLLVGLREKSV